MSVKARDNDNLDVREKAVYPVPEAQARDSKEAKKADRESAKKKKAWREK